MNLVTRDFGNMPVEFRGGLANSQCFVSSGFVWLALQTERCLGSR